MTEDTQFGNTPSWEIWKEILVFTRPYWLRIALLGGLMIFVALLDGVFPYMTKLAVDTYVVPMNSDGLTGFALRYGGLALMQGLNIWALIAIAGRLEVDLCRDLRRRGFEQLQVLSFSYYDKTPAGWILSRLTSDTMRLGETISWGIVDLVWGGAMMVAILGFMLVMSPMLTAVTMLVIPALLVVSNYFQKRILLAHRDARRINSHMSAAYNEGITGARTTKTLVREAENLHEFTEITGRLRSAAVRGSLFSVMYLPIVLLLSTVGSAIAVAFGGSLVISEVITIGTLIAFLGYTLQFFEPVREIARVLSEFQAAQASAERLIQLIQTEPEITDSPEVIATWGNYRMAQPEDIHRIQGEIEFRSVDFQDNSGETILPDFNLKIPAGQTVALFGEPGSGKSTRLPVWCRFDESTAGGILIDGVE